jgi:2-(1,2-epoxy-1,2-dihydrophenyl)acetyl-CoA isomerase
MKYIFYPCEKVSAMSETILIESHDFWTEFTLKRPARLIIFNDEMHEAIRKGIFDARDRGTRAMLITGSGIGYCAGQKLRDHDPCKMDGPPDTGSTLTNIYNPLIRLIRSLKIPIVIAFVEKRGPNFTGQMG